jgi:hypothetical protein
MGKHINSEGYEERRTKIMLNTPITELSRLIGAKWYLPLRVLAERSRVSLEVIRRALRGERIGSYNERKLREFLENYKGEVN